MRVRKHLHYPGQIVMGEATAEASVRLREHLRGLKTFRFADDDIFDVGGNYRGRTRPIDVVVATGLESFHESALAAIAERDDGHGGIFSVRANNADDINRAHFAHIGGAYNRERRMLSERGERECRQG